MRKGEREKERERETFDFIKSLIKNLFNNTNIHNADKHPISSV